MSIGADIYARLSGLASGRIYPVMAPQNVAAPFIVYSTVAATHLRNMVESSSKVNTRAQIDVWATTYAAAQTLAASVRSAMEPNGADFSTGAVEENPDFYTPDSDLFRVSVDFSIWHDEE